MPETRHTAYWEYLEARRAAITQAITADCVAKIELYRALPPEMAIQAIDDTVGVLLDALAQQDVAPLLAWVEQRILVRIDQGLVLTQALLLPAIFRQHLLGISLPAVVERMEGADEGMLFINSMCDAANDFMGAFYSRRLGETNATLRRFQRMAESAIDGIAMADAQFALRYANPAYRELTGYGDDIIGTPVNALLDPTTLDHLRDDILPVLEQAGSWKGIVSYQHADGTIFPVQLSVVMFQDSDGTFEGTAMVVRDIREERIQEQRLRMFESLVEKSVDGMVITDTSSTILYVNAATVSTNGFGSAEEMIGKSRLSLIAPEELPRVEGEIAPHIRESGSWQGQIWAVRPDGSRWLGQLSTFLLTDIGGAAIGLGGVTRDVTTEHYAEQERTRLQEEVIQMQQLALRELSTPLLALSDRVVVLPLVGTVDSRRAQQVIEALLEGITSFGADTAILDITGVPVVDTQVANALLRAAQAVRLLGAQIVLTGIRPEVAQTLVGLGADLSEIVSRGTLQSGIAYAMAQRARAGAALR
jgi:rsbT co-antagonist protein RsbR